MTAFPKPELILDRFCGREIHPITSFTWSLYHDHELDQQTFCIRLEAGPGFELHQDTQELDAEPFWEINIVEQDLPHSSLIRGAVFTLAEGYDETRGGHLTNFYYCEHEGSDRNRIEIVEEDGDRLLLRLYGETIDVNFYDGSKAPTQLSVETWFTYDAKTVRSMS